MFNDKVKYLMQQNGISQKELSELTGITEASVSRYLSGERTPRIDIIINFAKALKVDVDYLIFEDEEIKNREQSYINCRTILARNAKNLTPEEKNKLISIILNSK